jgi:N-acyl amino acid synthase of PEP-CTERM/exosortase system
MNPPFRPITLDNSAQLLAMSYRLRYQTFCLERLFFSKDEYPSQEEFDVFDSTSVHVGVIDAGNRLVGTARVVPAWLGVSGLPLLRYCTLFPEADAVLNAPANTVVELSRVCVNPRWTPVLPEAAHAATDSVSGAPGPESDDAFATLIKGMYQATKRLGGSHWIIAVEKALRRRLTRYGLPFRQAGPEADYHGPVAPYLLDIAELDAVIRSHRYAVLNDFPVELEREPASVLVAHSSPC